MWKTVYIWFPIKSKKKLVTEIKPQSPNPLFMGNRAVEQVVINFLLNAGDALRSWRTSVIEISTNMREEQAGSTVVELSSG